MIQRIIVHICGLLHLAMENSIVFSSEVFSELKNKNIPNLIIDLRENTGGNINMSNTYPLFKDKPFHVADTVAAIKGSLHYGKYIHPSLPYRIVMRLTYTQKN